MIDTPPAILFPVHGCDALSAPLNEQQLAAEKADLEAAVRMHWDNPGVQAIVKMIERGSAMKQARACAADATPHDAGQGFALMELNGRISRIKLTAEAARSQKSGKR